MRWCSMIWELLYRDILLCSCSMAAFSCSGMPIPGMAAMLLGSTSSKTQVQVHDGTTNQKQNHRDQEPHVLTLCMHKKSFVHHFPRSHSDVLKVKWTWEFVVLHAHFMSGLSEVLPVGEEMQWSFKHLKSFPQVLVSHHTWNSIQHYVYWESNLKLENQSEENSESGTKKSDSGNENMISSLQN